MTAKGHDQAIPLPAALENHQSTSTTPSIFGEENTEIVYVFFFIHLVMVIVVLYPLLRNFRKWGFAMITLGKSYVNAKKDTLLGTAAIDDGAQGMDLNNPTKEEKTTGHKATSEDMLMQEDFDVIS